MQNEQVILSKGYYKHAQIGDFISVKNYIYMRQSGKKCLLIRFFNEADFNVEKMDFTVVQLDHTGTVLEKTRVLQEDLRFVSGGYYTCQQAIVVHEACSDFKVILNEVISGNYRYCVKDGEVTAYYIKKREALLELSQNRKPASRAETFSVETKRFDRNNVAIVLATVAVLLFILMSALHMIFPNGFPIRGERATVVNIPANAQLDLNANASTKWKDTQTQMLDRKMNAQEVFVRNPMDVDRVEYLNNDTKTVYAYNDYDSVQNATPIIGDFVSGQVEDITVRSFEAYELLTVGYSIMWDFGLFPLLPL